MARIFNIYFTHENLTQSAVVSVKQMPLFTEFTLSNFSEDLNPLLPGNIIISDHPEHFLFQGANENHSNKLMEAIIKAVAEHLHATEHS